MKLAASDARKAMLCATSSTSPGRPRACVCWHLSRNWWRRRQTDQCCRAELLQHCYSFPLITALSRWTTAMGIMREWHWLDASPVCTAARLVLLSCGHLWWWRRGWGGEAKAATLVRSQILISQQYANTNGRLPLTTQSSPSLAYSPALKQIHFHFNCICQCLWCRTCSRRREKQLAHRGLCNVWTDRWQTWTCSKPAHRGTTGRKTRRKSSTTPHTFKENSKKPAARSLIPTDLCPFTLDTLTTEPLVLIRCGTQSWVRWKTDLQQWTKGTSFRSCLWEDCTVIVRRAALSASLRVSVTADVTNLLKQDQTSQY